MANFGVTRRLPLESVASDDQPTDWMQSSRNRSASPFNHHASFVRFSFVPDAVQGVVPNIVPNIIREATPEVVPEVVEMPCYQHNVTYSEEIKRQYFHLAKALGYRMSKVEDQEVNLVRADALTFIEKFTAGKTLTKRPRDMPSDEVKERLQAAIPMQYFILVKVAYQVYSKEDWVCEDRILAKAASTYVTELGIEKNKTVSFKEETTYGGSQHDELAIEIASETEAEDVEKALKNIEAWCDNWLEGKIDEAEWDTMEGCTRPDRGAI